MSSMPRDDVRLSRYREASEWVLRLNAPGASEEEVERWLHWCEAADGNLAAFESMQRDWQDTESFKQFPELLAREPSKLTRDPSAPAIDLSAPARDPSALARDLALPRSKLPHWGRRSTRWATVASVLIVAFAGVELWLHRPPHQVLPTPDQEPATLPDGSLLLLSAKATADVEFSRTARHVELRSGGEAYIKVHHDKLRPFMVHAGALTVTAVGTAFDVRRDADRVTVTVEEGTVIASATGINGVTQWRAGAGYQVSYSEDGGTAVVSRVDPQSALRWRDGELAYDDAPLEAVIADINRYSTVNVLARDPALLRLRFTGTVFVASVRDWVKALAAQYPVRARVAPNGDVELEPSGSADTPRP